MEKGKREKLIVFAAAVFVLIAFGAMFGNVLFSGFRSIGSRDTSKMPEATGMSEILDSGAVLEQSFVNTTSSISQIGIVFTRAYDISGVDLTIELLQGDKTLARTTYEVSGIADQHRTFVIPNQKLKGTRGKEYVLKIYTVDGSDTGLRVLIDEKEDSSYRLGGNEYPGTICFSVTD